MPYDIKKRGSQWCVVKRDDGKTMGCHSSRSKAERQRRAIHANEASAEGSTVNVMSVTEATPVNGLWHFLGPEELQNGYMTSNVNLQIEEENEEGREPWEGILGTEMSPTSDGRIIELNVGHRELPVPFHVQTALDEGHTGAECCGRIEEIVRIPLKKFSRREEFDLDDVHPDAILIYARGSLDGSEHAEDAKRLLGNGAGVSLDGLHFTGKLFDAETLEEIDTSEMEFDELLEGVMSMKFLRGMHGEIGGVTVVNIPAFKEAKVMIASAYQEAQLRFTRKALTAAAAGAAPLKPPKEWFFQPEPDAPTPLTVTKDGRVYGHLALWGQCHTSFATCETPPRSQSGYSFFHVGQIETEEGELVNVGRITVGDPGNAKGGHASIVLGRKGAMEHYDKTGCVAAFVRAVDGNHGIWLSGTIRSDVPAERIRDLRACPPSGDWRDYELVAVLSVVSGGFPIPRAEARLVASSGSEDEEVAALIATGYVPEAEQVTVTVPISFMREALFDDQAWDDEGCRSFTEMCREIARDSVRDERRRELRQRREELTSADRPKPRFRRPERPAA